jgi:phage terminase small subunit
MTLKNKKQTFIDAYLQCWNSAEAARRAGYSQKSARSIGQRLLTNVDISSEITQRLKKFHMGADEALMLLACQARASIRPFLKITPQGLISFDFSTPEALENIQLIKKIRSKRSRRVTGRGEDAEEWEDEVVELELHDGQVALQLLGKHLGLFENKPEQFPQLHIEGLDEMLDKVYGKCLKTKEKVNDG